MWYGNVLLVTIASTHPQRVLVPGPGGPVRRINVQTLLEIISNLEPLIVQLCAEHHILRVVVERTRPGLLADSEVSGGHLGQLLQAAVLAGLISIQTPRGLGSMRVVHHAVVHTPVQLVAVSLVHAVVEVRQYSLNGLPTPKVPNSRSSPTLAAEVSLDDDGSQLVEAREGGSYHQEPALHGGHGRGSLHVVVPSVEKVFLNQE